MDDLTFSNNCVILHPSKLHIHDLGKTRISIFNLIVAGLCVGQFVYPDENRVKEFQSETGRRVTHWSGFAGAAARYNLFLLTDSETPAPVNAPAAP